jgi:hypothetical protein
MLLPQTTCTAALKAWVSVVGCYRPGWRWFGGADQTSGGVPLLTTISCLAGVRFFSLQLFTVLNPASSRPHTFPRLRAGNEEWAGCRGEGG